MNCVVDTDTTGLPVCPKCGWHAGFTHDRGECKPEYKPTADMLIERAKGYCSAVTRFGYGYGNVTMSFGPDLSVTVRCYARGSFVIDHVHSLLDFNANDDRLARFLFSLATVAQSGV